MGLSSRLDKVKWFQVLLYNSHNLTSVICLHTICSIWPIERTLSSATTLGQSGPRTNGNEGLLWIPQISMAGTSLSDGLMSYPGNLLGGRSYSFAEMQMYFTPPSWLGLDKMWHKVNFQCFGSPQVVSIQKPKNPICPTIYP